MQQQVGSLKYFKGYCSKCAVKLAQRGGSFREILNSGEIARQKKIEEFFSVLDSEMKKCVSQKKMLKQREKDIQRNYEIQMEKLNGFFTAIYQ